MSPIEKRRMQRRKYAKTAAMICRGFVISVDNKSTRVKADYGHNVASTKNAKRAFMYAQRAKAGLPMSIRTMKSNLIAK